MTRKTKVIIQPDNEDIVLAIGEFASITRSLISLKERLKNEGVLDTKLESSRHEYDETSVEKSQIADCLNKFRLQHSKTLTKMINQNTYTLFLLYNGEVDLEAENNN